MEERLQEAIVRLLDHYDLPLTEALDLLFNEDYPPLIDGDLGVYEEELFSESLEEF